MKNKFYVLLAVLVACSMVFSSVVFAAGGSKNIKAYFNGIKIIVNGKQQASSPEPFVYNNTTYVPIRLVSSALGANVHWDAAKNAIVISSNAQQTQALEQQIANLNSQIAQKDSELNQLRQQNTYMGLRIGELEASLKQKQEEEKKDPAKELEEYLTDEYSRWNRMDFEYDVKGDEDQLKLIIGVDLSDYGSRWNSTDKRDIEDWLDEIYSYVDDNYPNADFYGYIEDIDKDKTLVEFDVSRGKLQVDFQYTSDDFSDLEDELNYSYGRDLESYDRDFGNLEANISVDGNENRERIFLTITVDTSEYGTEWGRVKNTSGAEDWIYDMVKYILDRYENYEVTGVIVNQRGNTMASFDAVGSAGRLTYDWDYSY